MAKLKKVKQTCLYTLRNLYSRRKKGNEYSYMRTEQNTC